MKEFVNRMDCVLDIFCLVWGGRKYLKFPYCPGLFLVLEQTENSKSWRVKLFVCWLQGLSGNSQSIDCVTNRNFDHFCLVSSRTYKTVLINQIRWIGDLINLHRNSKADFRFPNNQEFLELCRIVAVNH